MMTIWGATEHQEKLADGVYLVETPWHGGIIVSESIADRYLSTEAKKVAGKPQYGWYHFEEDCDLAVFAYENKDLVPKEWLEYIMPSLEKYNKEYLEEKKCNELK